MSRWRGTTTQRGLGAVHQKDKKRLLAELRDGSPCWRCGQPMFRWQKLDRDHLIDRSVGGANGPAVLAHASCNRSAGATFGNKNRDLTRPTLPGKRTICRCGKPYDRAPRLCEICGAHYHPSRGDQRTCGRTCGLVLKTRNRAAAGWVPKTQRPKPPKTEREPKNGWPSSPLQHYICRYCGTPGVTRVTGQAREVCPARECQLLRLKANNWRVRYGLTQTDADEQVMAARDLSSKTAWPAARRW